MADANVRVLVSALTEAAEESLDEVGQEMQGLSADGHIAAEGLDAADAEMSSATRTAMILQSALDEVGDEAAQAAAQSQAASGAFTSLSISSQGASLSIGSLSTAFTLSLIPAVMTAATVIAPLIVMLGALAAGAVALAGAFGLIIGSGILAFGEQKAQQNQEELNQTQRLIDQYETMRKTQGGLTAQQETRLSQLKEKKKELEDQTTATAALAGVVSDLKEELKPLIVDFGREFIPLIKEAVNGIPDLVQEMLNAVGGTDALKQALRTFGSVLADVLPTLIGLMFDLARAALPVLRDLVAFLQGNGDAALQQMKASVQELWPEMMNLLDALIDMAPVLLEFGTNVGEVLIPAITGLVRASTGFMETINQMDEGMQNAIISVLLLAPALIKLAGIGSTLAKILGYSGLRGALAALGGWLASLAPSAFQLGMAFQWVVNGVQAAASMIAGSTAALAAIGAAIGLVSVKILDMLGVFSAVEDAGESFAQMFGRDMVDSILVLFSILSVGLLPLLASLGAAIVELVRGDISGAVDAFLQVWGIFGSAFENVANMAMSSLSNFGSWFIQILSGVKSYVGGFITDLSSAFVNFFVNTLPQLAFDGLILLITGTEVLLNTLYNLFGSTFNGIIELISIAVDTVVNGVVDIVNQFLKGLDGVADAVSEVVGRDIGDVGTLDKIDTSQIAQDLQIGQRSTDFSQVEKQNREQAQGVQQQINNTEVSVDVGGDLKQSPYSFSRNLADQIIRENRQNSGS